MFFFTIDFCINVSWYPMVCISAIPLNLFRTNPAFVYNDEQKKFASTLYYYSPAAYGYARKHLPLPAPRTVQKLVINLNIIIKLIARGNLCKMSQIFQYYNNLSNICIEKYNQTLNPADSCKEMMPDETLNYNFIEFKNLTPLVLLKYFSPCFELLRLFLFAYNIHIYNSYLQTKIRGSSR